MPGRLEFDDPRGHARQQTISASAIAFSPGLSWGRPYIGVGAGWIWAKNPGVRNNSFLYGLQTGVELQATNELSITPYLSYTDASSLHVDNKWSYGVKANYWLTSQWGLTGGISRDTSSTWATRSARPSVSNRRVNRLRVVGRGLRTPP